MIWLHAPRERGGGVKGPYIRPQESWSSVNHSILSGCTVQIRMGGEHSKVENK